MEPTSCFLLGASQRLGYYGDFSLLDVLPEIINNQLYWIFTKHTVMSFEFAIRERVLAPTSGPQ
jgi:hypothetical protein